MKKKREEIRQGQIKGENTYRREIGTGAKTKTRSHLIENSNLKLFLYDQDNIASLDVESLFTNVPIDDTINIIINLGL